MSGSERGAPRRDGALRETRLQLSTGRVLPARGGGEPLPPGSAGCDALQRTADELRESEERARMALDAAELGTWRHDLRSGIVQLDARGAAHYAVPEGRATLDALIARVHRDDRARLDEVLAVALDPLRSTGRYALEYRVVPPDGSVRWLAVHARIQWEGEGAARRAVLATGTSQDVTERRLLEAALRDRDDKLRLAHDAAGLGAWELRLATGELVLTERCRELLELTGEDPITSDRFLGAVAPEDRARVESAVRDAIASRTAFDVELRVPTGDGTVRWAAVSGRASYDASGRPLRLAGVVADVSDRRRTDEERRLLMEAVQQSPASIVVTDADGTIQFVNAAFERVTGYSRDEALGQNPRFLKSGRHDAAFYAGMWATLAAGEVWNGRITNVARSGRIFTEDAVISPVRDAAGEIRSYVAVKRDVTDELELEQALFQSQKLESIGRLAGGVAHDFNNLLAVILGCTEELAREVGGEGAHRELIDDLRAAGQRARDVTRQLLAFARRQALEPVATDVAAVLRDTERLLRRVIGKDLELVVAAGPGLWAARCDPGRLQQVIVNLAVNARDATPLGGRIVVEAANVGAGSPADGAGFPGLPAGEYVRVAVRDTGEGMSEDVKARLFEPFFTTKAPGRGTGLGLATVYGIVKQCGGFVRAESELGIGTRFEVWLPRVEDLGDPEDASRG